ncbi:hypothetical protein Poly24_25670 [Rosistilla carotiformis]|uniref:Uncharacterized protein n=1 Tax=Rosistilla carotiformis TaxID=2528017 RepID=A0A518JTI2_9BACT|nr:hypothetical protein [Rosistilla carotiformis]QDV68854.1 hypothetical protein Poly24_25670 [Rosistilla carotiformis]
MALAADPSSPEFLAARHAAMWAQDGFQGVDETDLSGPCGHAYGIRKSAWLTTAFRNQYRPESLNVLPQEVMECLKDAEVTNWVLMGLYGYVGYLSQPRATQVVDVMIPYSQKKKAMKAIGRRWPTLQVRQLSQVVRFQDPAETDHEGQLVPVIDWMLPWSPFQSMILSDCVIEDPKSKHRYPAIEAAIVSKYAALVSPHREARKKRQDAVDFEGIVETTHARINMLKLKELAGLVWGGGADEIERFVKLAIDGQTLPY